MRQLLTLENALIRTGKDARSNPALTAFYEALATSGGLAGLKLIADQFKFHRVHCHVIKDFDRAVKFAEFLGFTKEAELKQFGPNKEDYYKLVKFYE